MTPGPAQESVSTPVTKKRGASNSPIEAVEREKKKRATDKRETGEKETLANV